MSDFSNGTIFNLTDEEYKARLEEEIAASHVTIHFPANVSYGAIIFCLGQVIAEVAWNAIEVGDFTPFLIKLLEYTAHQLDQRIDYELSQIQTQQSENNAPTDDEPSNVDAPDDILDAAAHGFDQSAIESTGF